MASSSISALAIIMCSLFVHEVRVNESNCSTLAKVTVHRRFLAKSLPSGRRWRARGSALPKILPTVPHPPRHQHGRGVTAPLRPQPAIRPACRHQCSPAMRNVMKYNLLTQNMNTQQQLKPPARFISCRNRTSVQCLPPASCSACRTSELMLFLSFTPTLGWI